MLETLTGAFRLTCMKKMISRMNKLYPLLTLLFILLCHDALPQFAKYS